MRRRSRVCGRISPRGRCAHRTAHHPRAPTRCAPGLRLTAGSKFPIRSATRPHRLEAKDSGFSRRQPGFESPWGRLHSASLRFAVPHGSVRSGTQARLAPFRREIAPAALARIPSSVPVQAVGRALTRFARESRSPTIDFGCATTGLPPRGYLELREESPPETARFLRPWPLRALWCYQSPLSTYGPT